ncbi:cytochrome P450 [Hysterangium stoloniferum]|nr:cytochrome P450 [Hysterangium stoloniferum]
MTLCIGMGLFAGIIAYRLARRPNYDAIPAIGGTDLFSSWKTAMDVTEHGRDMVQMGYDKYKPGIFRLPDLNRWQIIVCGQKYISEIARAPNDVFSFTDAVEERIFGKYLLGPTILSNPYHSEVVREKLTRSLITIFADVKEEIMFALEDNIPLSEEWTKVVVYPAITQIVARASGRVVVGMPLCRNPEYLNLSIRHAFDVSHGRNVLSRFPGFLRGVAGRLLTNLPKTIRLTHNHLGPMIEERQRKITEYGPDYPDKPNDFLSWLMDAAKGDERSPSKLTNRVMSLNVASIHTGAMTFAHTLFHLAAEPKYLAPLREEVEAIVKEDGWSKAAMSKMHKLDSFLKESQRLNSLGAMTLTRKALKDYTFYDGTFIPKGAIISAASGAIHMDDEIYPDARVFNGFRFSEMREKDGQGTRDGFVSTSPDYMSFGHGKHACPGRFFLGNELKLILAHIVLNYDVKMEKEGVLPTKRWVGFICTTDSSESVMFRRRRGG